MHLSPLRCGASAPSTTVRIGAVVQLNQNVVILVKRMQARIKCSPGFLGCSGAKRLAGYDTIVIVFFMRCSSSRVRSCCWSSARFSLLMSRMVPMNRTAIPVKSGCGVVN